MSQDAKKHWTFKDVAEYFGVNARTIRRMIDAGQFPLPRKFGKQRLFVSAEIEAFAERLPRGIGR